MAEPVSLNVHPPNGVSRTRLIRRSRIAGKVFARASLLGWLLLAATGAHADLILPEPVAPVTAHSISGQFVVHGKATTPPPAGVVPAFSDHPLIDLQPELLAVTAERVKTAVLRHLNAPNEWRGKIHLHLQNTRAAESQPIRIVPQLFKDGWYFWMVVPERVSWRRLVRALTEAVLLELANRSETTFVQTPLWLNEGLAGLIIAEEGRDIVLEARTALLRNQRIRNPLNEARALLGNQEPWSFSELGLPDPANLRQPAQWERFQGSAILLTHELLAAPEGKVRMFSAIKNLSQNLNWQTAFLKAHSKQFVSLLDVEKWWAVNANHVLMRDPIDQWTPIHALEQLDEVVSATLEIRTSDDPTPVRRKIRLAQLITETDTSIHLEVLEQKLNHLHRVYAHAPADILPLAVDYFETIDRYVTSRGGASPQANSNTDRESSTSTRSGTVFGPNRFLLRQTARRLEELDQRLSESKAILQKGS